MVPDRVPDLAFHPVGFDLSGASGPSALQILDFTAALSSQSTAEPQARIRRRSIQVISRTISQMNANLIRARQPLPFFQPGPIWAVDGVTQIPFLQLYIQSQSVVAHHWMTVMLTYSTARPWSDKIL
jgi:hypothetical protein